jgi:hypothetical protein
MRLALRPVADGVELDADQRRQVLALVADDDASLMNGEVLSEFSISDGEMFLPPAVMMMSLIRSTILRCVPSTHSPTSPVCSQPSASTARAGRLGLVPVAGEHAGCG